MFRLRNLKIRILFFFFGITSFYLFPVGKQSYRLELKQDAILDFIYIQDYILEGILIKEFNY